MRLWEKECTNPDGKYIMLTGQSIALLAEKIVTTTLTFAVLASCWACSAHSHGGGFKEWMDGLPVMPGCLLVEEELIVSGGLVCRDPPLPPAAQMTPTRPRWKRRPCSWHCSWNRRTDCFIPGSRLLAREEHCLAVKRFMGL